MKRTKRFKKWFQGVSLRTKLFAVAGVVIVVVLIAVVVLINTQKPLGDDSSLDESQAAAIVRRVRHDGNIQETAQKALKQGDAAKADEIYKSAIEAEKTATRKIQLTISKSGVLYTAGKYQEAIKAVQEVEDLSDDKYLVADWLSRLFEDQKQYTQAAHYYTLAGQWVSSPTNLAQLSKNYYDSRAAHVAALAKKS